MSVNTCTCGGTKASHAQTCRGCYQGSVRQRENTRKGGAAFHKSREMCRKGLHLWTTENIRPFENTFLCIPCEQERLRNTVEETALRNRRATLRKYGLTLEAFDQMLRLCNNRCQICNEEFEETPHIDHDHSCCAERKRSCGKCIRGLLCSPCNRGIGQFADNPVNLRKAAVYLEHTNC